MPELYLSEWPRDEALQTLQETELLLGALSEEEISREVNRMGCYFVPTSEGYASASSWLHAVMGLMRTALA